MMTAKEAQKFRQDVLTIGFQRGFDWFEFENKLRSHIFKNPNQLFVVDVLKEYNTEFRQVLESNGYIWSLVEFVNYPNHSRYIVNY